MEKLANCRRPPRLRMAPVYDHNRALFPELDSDQLAAPEWYIKHFRLRLGRDFLITSKGLLTENIRKELSALEEFEFRQHPSIHAELERLHALNKIVQERIRLILSD